MMSSEPVGNRSMGSSSYGLSLLLATSTFLVAGVSQVSAAEPGESASSALEEVVVTARKRDESLRDVSAAISAIGGDRLRDGVINDVRDLQNVAPELNVGEVVGLMKITMRGLGNTSNTRGEDTEVAFYVDGAVVARQEVQSMAMFDLDRVEVLRGPQGTLYGRNSTGGTLNLITAKPTQDFTGYVNLTAGNYNFMKLDTALSGPLSEGVLGRLAVTSISRSGYGTNVTTGNEIDDDHRWAARGHLQFNFSDSVGLLLSGEYARQKDASGLFTYHSPFYVVPSAIPPAPIPPAGTPPSPKGVGGFSDPNSRDGAGNIDPQLKRETRSLTGTFTWDIAENLALKNILNWRDMDYFVAQDLDLSTVVPTPVTQTGVVSIPMQDRQMSNELQLTYTTDKLTLIGGLYWFTEKLSGTTFIGETPRVNVWFARSGQSEGDSYAGFFNANYKATDWLTARVGGRYNHDKRSIANRQVILGTVTIPAIANTERTDSKYTGEYGLDLRFTEHGMFYYTFSQGYRQGAAVIMQTNNPILNPTTVKNHEVGFKWAAANGRFNVDLAVYDTNIKDLQRTQAVPLPSGAFNTLINNISGMEVKGAELSTQWAPLDQLILSGGVVYTDAKFTDYTSNDPLQFDVPQTTPSDPVITALNSRQLAGNTPQLTPEWKGNVSGEYTFALSGDKEFVVGVNASYVGKQYFDEFNREPFVNDSYTLWGSNLTYRPSDRNWSASLWGKNLGNEKAFADMSLSAVGIVVSKKFIDPRTYGVSVNYKF